MVDEKDILDAFMLFRAAGMVEVKEMDEEARRFQIALWMDIIKDQGVPREKFITACRTMAAEEKFFPSVGQVCVKAMEKNWSGRHIPNAEETKLLTLTPEDALPFEDQKKGMAEIRKSLAKARTKKVLDDRTDRDNLSNNKETK